MGSLKSALRTIERGVRESSPCLTAGYAVDLLIASLSGLRRRGGESAHLLLPTNGGGNIGDQAMFEAFLANTEGPVIAIVRSESDFVVPAQHRDRLRMVRLPRLVQGARFGRKRETGVFARLLSRSADFSIVGADIMDGGYDRGEAVRRAQLLRIAAHRGVPGRVVGFSWNGRPDPVARRELRAASRNARLFARDPLSFQRLTADGITTEETVDTVFALDVLQTPSDLQPWVDADERPIVTVNVSGLILRKTDLSGEFAKVVRELLQRGCRVLLLPHVVRTGDDDLEACRSVRALLGDEAENDVKLVDRVLAPGEVAWVADRSAAVLTGRMHLAILSLRRGTVPTMLATQGKVEGLAALFGLEEFVLDPRPGLADFALDRIDRVLASDECAKRVERALPEAIRRAQGSFDGLSG